jgi:hypothetical protein
MKKLFLILIIIGFSIKSLAQSEYKISYNEKINLGSKNQNIVFSISDSKSPTRLIGNEINDYVFQNPGEYTIFVQDKTKHKTTECEHAQLPKKITVKVSPFKIKFDANTISFSQPIEKNKETTGTVLSIFVNIETYNHQSVVLDLSPVNSAGIGTSIIANLDKRFAVLPEGIHNISYLLTGKVTENSYLMFDFVEPNGNIQSVAMTNPIQN